MADKELLQSREQLIEKTINREKTKRIPFLMIADAYIPYYTNTDLKDVNSYEKAAELTKRFYDDLEYDCTVNGYMPAQHMVSPSLKLLGGGAHVVGENMIKQINQEETLIMEPEDYPAFIENPAGYVLETLYPKRYPLLESDVSPEEKYTKFLELMQEGMRFGEYLYSTEVMTSAPVLANRLVFYSPVDIIFDLMRNFTGIMRDVKRCPDYVKDAGLALVDDFAAMGLLVPPVSHKGLFCPMHLPAFLRPKDFEKVYWPSFKKLIEAYAAQGHNIMCYFEKNYSHLYDYLQELPKDRIIGIFEEDDLIVTKDKLGGMMSIAGGLKTSTMGYGTKEECVNMTKKVIDDVGQDGGFFIAPDTPLCFPADAKPENLRVVADTIHEYGKC